MKSPRCSDRFRQSGQGLVIVIILLVIIGGSLWWLVNNKTTMERQARDFGREAIERITVQHDPNFFSSHLSPQLRLEKPPSEQQFIISQFQQMGVPNQPINIEGQVTFESHFFSPRGDFTANLFYPTQSATLQISVSHPVGKWQLDSFNFTPGPTH